MSDYQRVIDDIRFTIQADAVYLTDNLKTLAEIYAGVSHETNVRLRRCEEFLRQNLRSEAVHLAESSPNLLEMVAILDFPERDQWVSTVEMYSLTRPEPLLMEVAASLNAAYTELQPLESLLNRQRLLALSRSPLPQRLGVLRQLANYDPASPFWQDDIRKMEQARFERISEEIPKRVSERNLEALELLEGELISEPWLETVPDELRNELRQRIAQTRVAIARDELSHVERELGEAFNALDLPRAKELQKRWHQILPIARLSAKDPLMEQAAPALGWVNDQLHQEERERDYRAALAQLESALDREQLGTHDLERLGSVVESFGRGCPDLLWTRYGNRLEALRLGDRRRRIALVGTTVTILALVIGSVSVFSYFAVRNHRANQIAETVEQLVDGFQFAQAQQLVDQHPEYAGVGRWLAAVKKLAEGKQKEQDRLVQLEQALKKAETAETLAEGQAALADARRHSRIPEEQSKITRLEARWKERQITEQATQDRQFQERVLAISEALKELDQAVAKSPEDPRLLDRLTTAKTEIEHLEKKGESVSKSIADEVKFLRSRQETIAAAYQQASQRHSMLKDLTFLAAIRSASADPEKDYNAYLEKLREMARKFPNENGAKSFQEVANRKSAVQIVRWVNFQRNMSSFLPLDEKDASARIAECQRLLTGVPETPVDTVVQDYRDFLDLRLKRLGTPPDGKDAIKQQLMELFSPKNLPETHALKTRTNKTYYLEKAQDFTGRTSVSAFALTGPGQQTRRISLDPDKLASTVTVPAPYLALGQNLRTTARSITADDWEDGIFRLVSELRGANDVDPFLRFALILKTLEAGIAGSPLLANETSKWPFSLKDDQFSLGQNWMDPENPGVEIARDLAKRLLERIPNSQEVLKRVQEQQRGLESRVRERIEAVGWLYREPSGTWRLLATNFPPEETALEIPGKSSGGAPVWKVVGQLSKGKAILNPDLEKAGGYSGDLVFRRLPHLKSNQQAQR